MSLMVPIALFGWIGVTLTLFASLPPRRAVLASYIGAWLFLPMASYGIPGLPDYGKATAASLGAFLGVLMFDFRRLSSFRPTWMDLPAILFCLCPIATSVSNDLGVYDGLSAAYSRVLLWGIPYVMGRLYLKDLICLRELVIAVFIGGLVYMPLCILEMRISPQLHRLVYGYHQHSFLQTIRWGGFRPMVFMQHGLAVAGWMAAAALCSLWLWQSGSLKRLWGVPMAAWAAALLITTVMCRSGNAVGLLVLGAGTLYFSRLTRTAIPLVCLALAVPLYMVARFTGAVPRGRIVEAIGMVASAERAGSLDARMRQEDAFSTHTWKRPVFGWGGWQRNFPTDGLGDRMTRGVDSLWVIVMSMNGLAGLAAMSCMMLLPVVLLPRHLPAREWIGPITVGAVGSAMMVILFMIDGLANAMLNPVFVLGAGGLAGLHPSRNDARRRAFPRGYSQPSMAPCPVRSAVAAHSRSACHSAEQRR